MREIKFRAWCKKLNKMYYSVGTHPTMMEWVDGYREDAPGALVVSPLFDNYILMQYTGLKDRNGKYIYEDDIIECFCKYHDGEKYIVNYEDGGFYPFADNDDGAPYVKAEECEVVGNIHENK